MNELERGKEKKNSFNALKFFIKFQISTIAVSR